jgi:hypothetical protein
MSNEVKVTILPPGRCEGAGDLHAWSGRRLAGLTGMPGPIEKKGKLRKSKKQRMSKQQRAARRAADEKDPIAELNRMAAGGNAGAIRTLAAQNVSTTLPRTEAELQAAMSERARRSGIVSPSKAQCRAWGVPWPLRRGWKEKLLARANGGQAPPPAPRKLVFVTRARARLDRLERLEREAKSPRTITGPLYGPSDDDSVPWG